MKGLLKTLAGAPGFEPGNGGIKIRCLTTWLRPNGPVVAKSHASHGRGGPHLYSEGQFPSNPAARPRQATLAARSPGRYNPRRRTPSYIVDVGYRGAVPLDDGRAERSAAW